MAADTGLQTRLKLAGQQYDQQTGLYYMRARYYDPALGRFLSEDPIGIAGGLNLYAYAGNDPVNQWDPTGLSAGVTCDWVWYELTWRYIEGDRKGEISRITYERKWECTKVSGGGDAWGGVKSGSSSTASSPSTMGQSVDQRERLLELPDEIQRCVANAQSSALASGAVGALAGGARGLVVGWVATVGPARSVGATAGVVVGLSTGGAGAVPAAHTGYWGTKILGTGAFTFESAREGFFHAAALSLIASMLQCGVEFAR